MNSSKRNVQGLFWQQRTSSFVMRKHGFIYFLRQMLHRDYLRLFSMRSASFVVWCQIRLILFWKEWSTHYVPSWLISFKSFLHHRVWWNSCFYLEWPDTHSDIMYYTCLLLSCWDLLETTLLQWKEGLTIKGKKLCMPLKVWDLVKIGSNALSGSSVQGYFRSCINILLNISLEARKSHGFGTTWGYSISISG